MPFALVLIGLTMIVVGAKNTYRQFGAELVSDFTGPNNFVYWLAAIGGVGALGYIPQLRTFSRYFMALILIAMLLSNKGFFQKLSEALTHGPVSLDKSPNISTAPGSAVLPGAKDQAPGSTPASAQPTDAQGNFLTFIDGLGKLAKAVGFSL